MHTFQVNVFIHNGHLSKCVYINRKRDFLLLFILHHFSPLSFLFTHFVVTHKTTYIYLRKMNVSWVWQSHMACVMCVCVCVCVIFLSFLFFKKYKNFVSKREMHVNFTPAMSRNNCIMYLLHICGAKWEEEKFIHEKSLLFTLECVYYFASLELHYNDLQLSVNAAASDVKYTLEASTVCAQQLNRA
jgi:hypothetical protein